MCLLAHDAECHYLCSVERDVALFHTEESKQWLVTKISEQFAFPLPCLVQIVTLIFFVVNEFHEILACKKYYTVCIGFIATSPVPIPTWIQKKRFMV